MSLTDVTLYPITNNFVYVSTDQQNPQAFHNIEDAVYYLEDHGGGTVNVHPGTYTGSENSGIRWIPYDIGNNEEIHIKIKGLSNNPEQCIIDCGVTFVTFDDSGFSGWGWGNGYNYADVIENLTIKNASCGIKIENGSPIIRNNIIEDCHKNTTYNPGDILGVGISCKSSATIENNIFQNNEGYAHHDLSISYGGGIYLENNTESPAIISGNEFYNCGAEQGGAVYCTGDGEIILNNNIFEANYALPVTTGAAPASFGSGIYCSECSNIDITNNILTYHVYSGYWTGVVCLDECVNMNFTNNTIMHNALMRGLWIDSGCSEITLRNSIFSYNRNGIYLTFNQTNIGASYCNFYENTEYNYSPWMPHPGSFFSDPQIDMLTYKPIWNIDGRSPCIDGGNPSSPLDPDGTRADVGAKRATVHKVDTIELPSPEEDDGWKWLSFPALDTVWDNADVAENVLDDILDPTILDIVEAQDYIIEWNGYSWLHDYEQFSRMEGFKFHMNQVATLEVTGFKEPDNTTITLEGNPAENWIGYWLEETQSVEDAFSQYWDGDNITGITAQHWSAFKFGDTWFCRVEHGYSPTLSYGDMVIVRCNTTISNFRWDNSTPEDPRVSFTESINFNYTQQADYVSIFIEVDPEDPPLEIGAIVNGECIGATVVEDTLVQIRAYTTSVPPGNIELELYYGGRSENKKLSSYRCVNFSDPDVVMTQISTKSYADAWFISLREESNIVPAPEKVSLSNYPNPFNPATTISYSLPQEGKVSLKIYNVKGQLVKKLIDGSQPEGYYEVVWNGKDNTGRSVASGIYYYQINACGKTINKKMLLLK